MNYLFTVADDLIKENQNIELYSGNVDTYTFSFEFSKSWDDFSKFAVFTKQDKSYNVAIIDNKLNVPYQVLDGAATIKFGLYAISENDSFKRLSTNLLTLEVMRGAYSKAPIPEEYEPDFLQSLISSKEDIKNKSLSISDTPSNEMYTSETAVAEFVNNKIKSAIYDSWEAEI